MDTTREYKICLECGEIFATTGKSGYCSPVCRDTAKNRPKPDKLTESIIGWRGKACTCVTCGKSFYRDGINQLRCPECLDKGVPLPSKIAREYGRFLILSRDNFRCIYCGRSSVEDRVKLHVDHIAPRANGGISKASNLVTACQTCNLEKHTASLNKEARDRIKEVVKERNRQVGINDNQVIKLHARDNDED